MAVVSPTVRERERERERGRGMCTVVLVKLIDRNVYRGGRGGRGQREREREKESGWWR